MTKFNPENKEWLTYREALDPAMKITEQEDADQYLKDYIAYTQKHLDSTPRTDSMTAEQIAKTNIGYFSGYCSPATAERVKRLFKCSHPIFDNVANN